MEPARGRAEPGASRYTSLLVEQIGRVRRVTINRPEVKNALSITCQEELVDAVLAAARDEATHVVVVRGAGSAFSSGYDLSPRRQRQGLEPARAENEKSAYRGSSNVEADLRSLFDTTRRWGAILHADVPVIAQVHGHCLAGATDLVQHCDLVIVAEDAVIGCPPVRSMGVPPTHMWIYHVGPQWAKRLLLTGDTMTGRRAAEIGFALEAVPADQLDGHVLALAERIAMVGRSLLRANKYVVNKALELMGRDALQEISAAQDAIAHLSPEFAEFKALARDKGLKHAVRQRDAGFRNGEPL
ncbi:MAG: crotonase/enoyl-CoA hydratase family protein [Actinomycetota bacterium]